MTDGIAVKKKSSIHWGILVGVAIGMLNSMIIQTMMSTSMSTISKEFNSKVSYSWIYGGYVLASAMTMPLFGHICDKFGSKKNFIIGYIIFTAGTLVGWSAPNMAMLILSRVIMGLGSGISVPAIYGIIGEYFEKKSYKIVFATLALITIVGKGLGSIWGSYFISTSSWRNGFLSLLPLEIVAIILIAVFVAKTSEIKNDSVLNVRHALILSAAICCLMFGFDRMTERPLFAILLPIGVLLLIWIFVSESKKENGVIPYEMKNNKKLQKMMIQMFFMGACINVAIAYFPTVLQTSLGMSVKMSSICLVIYVVGSGIGSILGATMKGKGSKSIFGGWGSVVLGCFLSFICQYTAGAVIYVGLVLIGVGLGILGTVLLSNVVEQAEDNKSTVSSLTHLTRNIGASLGVMVFGGVLGSTLSPLSIGLFICAAAGFVLNIRKGKA